MDLRDRIECWKPSPGRQEMPITPSRVPPAHPNGGQHDTRLQVASVTCSLLSARGSILMGDQGPQEQYYIEKVSGRGVERSWRSEPST